MVRMGLRRQLLQPDPSQHAVRLRLQRLSHPARPDADARLGWPALQVREREVGQRRSPTLAMFSNETDSGKNSVATQASGYAGAGFDVVYAKGLLPPPPIDDVTPYVQELLTSNDGGPPDAMVCLLSIDCLPVWAQLQANNYAGRYQSTLYSDLLDPSPCRGGRERAVPAVRREHAGPAADGRADPRVQARRGDQLGCGGLVLRGRHAHQHAEAAQEVRSRRSLRRTCRRPRPRPRSRSKGLFGPTKFPDSYVRPTPGLHGDRVRPTAPRGRPSSRSSARRRRSRCSRSTSTPRNQRRTHVQHHQHIRHIERGAPRGAPLVFAPLVAAASVTSGAHPRLS